MKIAACAVTDPLDPRTFSGYSSHLFSALATQAHEIVPFATRDVRFQDLFTGALERGNLLRLPPRRPFLSADWFWSRCSYNLMCERLERRIGDRRFDAVIQIGTHVALRQQDIPFYCITDATVRQVASSGTFSISRANSRTIAVATEIQAEVFSRCERIFVLCDWTAAGIVADYRISSDKIVVIGAGANIPADCKPRAEKSGHKILFVGYDWERKGGPLLLESFRIVRRSVPDAELLIVGCRPDISEQGVTIFGALDRSNTDDRQRLLDCYAEASIFSILPTFDPFPNVLLEAASFSLPVVSTDEGSRREAVVHGETGLIAHRRDPDEIAALLSRLLLDKTLASDLGRAAAERAHTKFSWSEVARRLLDEIC